MSESEGPPHVALSSVRDADVLATATGARREFILKRDGTVFAVFSIQGLTKALATWVHHDGLTQAEANRLFDEAAPHARAVPAARLRSCNWSYDWLRGATRSDAPC